MNLAPGVMLSEQLQLERELGAGGMGSVWVARNRAHGGLVAVKVLHPIQGEHAAGQRARFEQEARGLARLDHPHLVKIYDFGMTSTGDPYIVMELLQGEDLAVRIKRSGAINVGETARIVAQSCNALACAHAGGVIHRDIKPANIFLMSGVATQDTFVKLVDFGVAKFASAELDLTRTGDMVGTPYFMSPEQFLTPKAVDARTDLWSLGVVVYACLTGELPFVGETLAALSIAVTTGRFRLPRTHRSELPVALDHFMTRALSTDPNGRYGSAREFTEAFGRAAAAGASLGFVANESAPPGGPPAPVLSPVATWQPMQAPSTGATTSAPRRAVSRWVLPVLGLALVATATLAVLYFAQSARPVATAKASASAESEDGPVDLVKTPPGSLYERAVREARKKHDTVELTNLSYTNVLPDGLLSADGRAKFYFGTPTWRCIVVAMTSEGIETKVDKCAKQAAVPYPKCTLPELRKRMRGKYPESPANLVYSQIGSAVPQWSLSVGGKGGFIPDDC